MAFLVEQTSGNIQKYFWPDLTDVSCLVSNSASQTQMKKVLFRIALTRNITQFLLAILFSRAMFPAGIYPGAAPFAIAGRQVTNRWEPWLVMFGVLAGTWSVSNWENAVWLTGSLGVIHFSRSWCQRLKRTSLINLALFGIWVLLRFGVTFLHHPVPLTIYQTAIELTISGLLLILFQWGFRLISQPSKVSKWSFLGLTIMAVVALGGITGLKVCSLEISDIFLPLLM